MRKHFLILMLLTLLPLAGWATNYDVTVTPQPKSSVYGTPFAIDESWFTINVGDPGTLKTGIKNLIQVDGVESTDNVGGHAYKFAFINNGNTSVTIGGDTYNVFLSETTATLTITQANDNSFTTEVAMAGWTYGEAAANPTSTPKWGAATYQYKLSTAADETYTDTKPSDAGTYTVKATVAANDNWSNVATSTANFTIEKGDNAWNTQVAMDGWTYGETAANPTSTPKWGTATYQYKVSTAGDETYTATKPEDAGTYTVKATVAATDNWNAAITSTADFTIARAAAGLVADNIYINGAAVAESYKYSDALALAASYNGTPATTAAPYFRFSSDGGANWVENPAIAKGDNWLVGCGAMQNTNYNAGWVNKSFTITAGDQAWATELAADNSVFGEALNVTEAVAQYENAGVTLYYKKTTEDDGAYTTTVPTAVGEYNVKAVAAETTNYAALTSDVATFSITPAQAAVASAPVVKTGLNYNGGAQELVTAGTATNGTMKYRIGNEGEFDAAVPTAKDAGTYTIWYMVDGDDNYSDVAAAELGTVEIAKVGLNYALGNQTSVFDGKEIIPTGNYALMAGSFAPGESLNTLGITFTFPGAPTNVEDGATFTSLDVNYADENAPKNYVFSFTGSSILTITPKAFDEAMIKNFTASADWDNTAKAPGYTVEDGDPNIITADDYDVVITKDDAVVTAANVKDAGEYTYTFTPKANYAGDAVEKIFTINGKTLAAAMLKTPATWTETATYNGSNKVPASIVLKDGSKTLGNAEYELVITNTQDEDEDGKNDVVTEAIGVDTYTFTFTGKGNYTGSFTKTLAINPKTLADGDFALAATTAAYTAGNLLPNVTTSLAKDVDYTVAVTNDAAEVVTEAKDVDTYTFTFTGKGNYTGAIQKTFAITPATVLVSVAANISKDYDGTTAFGAQKPSLEYSGLKGGDTKDVVTFDDTEVAAISAPEVEAAPGVYNLVVDVNQLHATNYVFAANAEITRTFTINAVGLVITFANNYDEEEITDAYKKVYGEEDNFDAAWKNANIAVGGALNDEEKAAIIAGINVVRAEGEDVNTYQLSIEVTDAEVFDNYNAPSCGNATFAITPATLQVALKNDEGKEYDGNEPDAIAVTADKLAVSGYKYTDGIAAITTLPTATVVDGTKNAGTYVITLDGAVAANYVFQYSDARYVIARKKLAKGSVTIAEQTLQAGSLASNFDADAYSVANLAGEDNYADIWGIKVADAHITKDAEDNDIITGETDANGIELYVVDADAAANYDFAAAEVLYGNLVIPSATSIYLSRGDRSTQSIAAGADNIFAVNQNNATVEFDSFAMDAKKWYAMVLPFEVNMFDLMTAFGGYVAVDVLDETNTNGARVNFELNGEAIPEHTPFLIKLFAAKNLNTVKFTGRSVKATKDANTTKTDAAENQFIGTYAGKKFNGDNANCFILSLNSGLVQPASATATVYPLGAYIHTADANARIFVE